MTTYIETVRRLPTMKPLKDGNAGNDVVKKASETASNDVKAEAEKIDFSKVEIEPLFKDFVDFETFSKSDFRAVKVLACEAVPKSKKLLKFTLDDGTGAKQHDFKRYSRILRAGGACRQDLHRNRTTCRQDR